MGMGGGCIKGWMDGRVGLIHLFTDPNASVSDVGRSFHPLVYKTTAKLPLN